MLSRLVGLVMTVCCFLFVIEILVQSLGKEGCLGRRTWPICRDPQFHQFGTKNWTTMLAAKLVQTVRRGYTWQNEQVKLQWSCSLKGSVAKLLGISSAPTSGWMSLLWFHCCRIPGYSERSLKAIRSGFWKRVELLDAFHPHEFRLFDQLWRHQENIEFLNNGPNLAIELFWVMT